MKVKTINYQKVFPLAQYVNERIGIEIEVGEDEDVDSAFVFIKELVHNWAEQKSQLHDSSQFVNNEPQRFGNADINGKSFYETTEERRIGDLAADIRSCDDLRVLETYRLLVQTKPEFKAIYDEMHKKLSPKPTKETNLKNK